MNRRVGALLAGTVAALACPVSATGATFTAGCTAGDGDEAGLIAAIGEANTVAGADTVQLGQGCVYRLTTRNNPWYGPNGLPAIGSDITIEGNGSTDPAGSTRTVAKTVAPRLKSRAGRRR